MAKTISHVQCPACKADIKIASSEGAKALAQDRKIKALEKALKEAQEAQEGKDK